MDANRDNSLQFLVDVKGNRRAVVLDIEQYEELLECQEELDSIREYDKAKAEADEVIPFEQAIREIEEQRE